MRSESFHTDELWTNIWWTDKQTDGQCNLFSSHRAFKLQRSKLVFLKEYIFGID